MRGRVAIALQLLLGSACSNDDAIFQSRKYFENVLGVAADIQDPIYLCRRGSIDFAMVAAYQVPPDLASQLRSEPSILDDHPVQRDSERDYAVVQWTQGLPTGTVAAAIDAVLPSVPFVQGGECEGVYLSSEVERGLSVLGGPNSYFAVRYKVVGETFSDVEYLLLDLNTERLYLVESTF